MNTVVVVVCEHGESPAYNLLKRRKINMSGDVVPSLPKNSWDFSLFSLPFSKPVKTSQKPLKNLSFFSTFWHEIWHFLTPDSENRTPDLTLFDPRNLRNLHFLGSLFVTFFSFGGHFLSVLTLFSVFGVGFHFFEIRGHFSSFLRSKNALFNH